MTCQEGENVIKWKVHFQAGYLSFFSSKLDVDNIIAHELHFPCVRASNSNLICNRSGLTLQSAAQHATPNILWLFLFPVNTLRWFGCCRPAACLSPPVPPWKFDFQRPSESCWLPAWRPPPWAVAQFWAPVWMRVFINACCSFLYWSAKEMCF